jgi:hypothetical protein
MCGSFNSVHIGLLRLAAQVTYVCMYIQRTPLRTIANDIHCLPLGYDVTTLHMYYETCLQINIYVYNIILSV